MNHTRPDRLQRLLNVDLTQYVPPDIRERLRRRGRCTVGELIAESPYPGDLRADIPELGDVGARAVVAALWDALRDVLCDRDA